MGDCGVSMTPLVATPGYKPSPVILQLEVEVDRRKFFALCAGRNVWNCLPAIEAPMKEAALAKFNELCGALVPLPAVQ